MRILICIGGLPYGKPTLLFGNLIAGFGSPEVTLLTVIESARKRAAAKRMQTQAQELLDMPARATKIRRGAPVDEIVREAQDGDYEMIVVGEHIVRGLVDLFLRSITGKVADRAPSSVLVVKSERPVLRRILICTGGLQMNRSVVQIGAHVAQAAGAQAKLLHVADPVPGMYTGLDSMDETMPKLLQTETPIARHLRWSVKVLAQHQVSPEVSLRHGLAVDEILREANEGDYDLVVIGPRIDKSLLDGWLMSKVTPQIVDRAPCSVLVVRAK